MTSRSRRLRISITEERYALLEGQAARRGFSVNVQAWICLLDGMDAQAAAFRRQGEALGLVAPARGDLHRDIEQPAIDHVTPEGLTGRDFAEFAARAARADAWERSLDLEDDDQPISDPGQHD